MGLFNDSDNLEVGNWVWVETFKCEGEVINIIGDECEVQLEGDFDTEWVKIKDVKKLY